MGEKGVITMNTNEFTIKRRNTFHMVLGAILFMGIYPFVHNQYFEFFAPIKDTTSILLYLIATTCLFYLLYPLIQFTVKVTDKHIVVNSVSTVPYEDIKKVYVGRFDFIESFEERDKLPLLPFKDKTLESFFKGKEGKGFPSGYFLVLHTKENLFFIKASYFDKRSFLRLVLALDSKNFHIEAEESFLKEKAF
jgi:hypothetical protein